MRVRRWRGWPGPVTYALPPPVPTSQTSNIFIRTNIVYWQWRGLVHFWIRLWRNRVQTATDLLTRYWANADKKGEWKMSADKPEDVHVPGNNFVDARRNWLRLHHITGGEPRRSSGWSGPRQRFATTSLFQHISKPHKNPTSHSTPSRI